jgi:hypothetical protein
MKSHLSSAVILGLSVVLFSAAWPGIVVAKGIHITGARGGSVSASATQKGNKVTGSATATSPNGKTATAVGTATVLPGKVTGTGLVTGPNGGTTSGTVSASPGTVSASGTATGKNGKTVSGSVTAAPGTATLTSGSGASKTFTKSNP